MENLEPVERRAQPSNPTMAQWFAVLVAAALVVALGPLAFRQLGSSGLPQTKMLLASIAPTDSTVEIVLAQPIWGETRGDGEGASLPRRERFVSAQRSRNWSFATGEPTLPLV
jgi:hypothetical protein